MLECVGGAGRQSKAKTKCGSHQPRWVEWLFHFNKRWWQYDTENAAAGSGYEFDADYAVDVLYAMNGIKRIAEFLKMIFEFVVEPITHLVNLSIEQSKFANS
jgi:hypothetical protein